MDDEDEEEEEEVDERDANASMLESEFIWLLSVVVLLKGVAKMFLWRLFETFIEADISVVC